MSSREEPAHGCLSLRPGGLGAGPAARAEQGGPAASAPARCGHATPGHAEHQAPGQSLCRGVSGSGPGAGGLGLVPGSGRLRSAHREAWGGRHPQGLSALEKPSSQEGPGRVHSLKSKTRHRAGVSLIPTQLGGPSRSGVLAVRLCPAPTQPRPLLASLPEGWGVGVKPV